MLNKKTITITLLSLALIYPINKYVFNQFNILTYSTIYQSIYSHDLKDIHIAKRIDDMKEPPSKIERKDNTNNTSTPNNNRESGRNIKDTPNFVDPHTIKDPPYNRKA